MMAFLRFFNTKSLFIKYLILFAEHLSFGCVGAKAVLAKKQFAVVWPIAVMSYHQNVHQTERHS
jgi:hypothetical protein